MLSAPHFKGTPTPPYRKPVTLMKHTQVLSFAFSLQALQAYLLCNRIIPRSHRTDIQTRYFFSLLCELAWTCEAKAEIVKFSRAAVNLHMDWGLFIFFVSRLVCLTLQALLGILIWLTAPSHSSCPCFRQMLLHLCLYQQNSDYSSSVKTFYAWGGAESLCLDGIPASEVVVITMENSYHY